MAPRGRSGREARLASLLTNKLHASTTAPLYASITSGAPLPPPCPPSFQPRFRPLAPPAPPPCFVYLASAATSAQLSRPAASPCKVQFRVRGLGFRV